MIVGARAETGSDELASETTISSRAYYSTYNGHKVEYLTIAHEALRRQHRSVVFLAGDSSLDNKAWFEDDAPAVNGYEEFLRPPRMKTDVCYWLNHEAVQRGLGPSLACLNTAVEATTLCNRAKGLWPSDQFIHDHIRPEDQLVVSIGGNDIALLPRPCTILNMLGLVRCSSSSCLRRWACGCLPCGGLCHGSASRTGCWGCWRSLTTCAWPPCLGYFLDLFGTVVRSYILKVLGSSRPKRVIVCMIYFLDKSGRSWADDSLRALDYNKNPARLQEAIRAVFRLATKRIHISGTEVVAFPLFEVLDGETTSDYVSRVEPSPSGGQKMARALMDVLVQ